MLSDNAREKLLDIARRTVEAAVKNEDVPEVDVDEPELQEKRGVFVTLKTDGRLRGCLGRFEADMPLWKTVQTMAVSAAKEDPRFAGQRITPKELDDLHVEISVLSPMEKTDNPMELELGTHGIDIKKGFRTGCFLPQVAEETGWSKETFLSRCCSGKAGLTPDAWKKSDTEVYIFTAEVISDGDDD